MYVGLRVIFSTYSSLEKSLLLPFPATGREHSQVLRIESMAVLLFLIFGVNFYLCFVGYCFWYNPTGTLNPVWTEVFG